jgi:2-iminobutanoate/2-iminopropanoate deaminase
MSIEIAWPDGVYAPGTEGNRLFGQVVATPVNARSLYVSGTFGVDAEGRLVDGGLGAEVAQALENIRLSLAAFGARPADVVQIRTYLTGDLKTYISEGHPRWLEFFGDHRPAAFALQAVSLANPAALVEIEAVAAVAVP